MTGQFEQFFPNAMFTNNRAFQVGATSALDVLRQIDLTTNHPGSEGRKTQPLNDQKYIYRVVGALAWISGVSGQPLEIARGSWDKSELTVGESEGGMLMRVGINVGRWGKQIDLLTGRLEATCAHGESYGSLRYAILASIVWDEASQATIGARTDGHTRQMFTSQTTPGRGHRVGRHLFEGDVSGNGREGDVDPTDKI